MISHKASVRLELNVSDSRLSFDFYILSLPLCTKEICEPTPSACHSLTSLATLSMSSTHPTAPNIPALDRVTVRGDRLLLDIPLRGPRTAIAATSHSHKNVNEVIVPMPKIGSLSSAADKAVMSLSITDYKAALLKQYAFASQTKSGHASAWKSWLSVCHETNNVDLTPTVESLGNYIAFQNRLGFKREGIRTYIGSIGSVAMDNGMSQEHWNSIRSSRHVTQCLEASRKQQAILGIVTKHAAPMSIECVHDLCNNAVTTGKFDDALLAAVVCIMFFGIHRADEIVSGSTASDLFKHVTKSNVSVSNDAIAYTVMSQKTAHSVPVSCSIKATDCPSWAFDAIKNYHYKRLCCGWSMHPDYFVTSSAEYTSWSWLDKQLKSIDPLLTPHSCRVGGATWLALMGASALTIMKRGRWSSGCFLDYIRETPHFHNALVLHGTLPADYTFEHPKR